jgi:hypothetical protein
VKGCVEGKVKEVHVEIVTLSFVRGYTDQYWCLTVSASVGVMNANSEIAIEKRSVDIW